MSDKQYLRRDPFPLNSELEVKYMKRARNQEVTLVVLGLNFTTEDEVIFDYTRKFGGTRVNINVTYVRDKQGNKRWI